MRSHGVLSLTDHRGILQQEKELTAEKELRKVREKRLAFQQRKDSPNFVLWVYFLASPKRRKGMFPCFSFRSARLFHGKAPLKKDRQDVGLAGLAESLLAIF